MRNAAEWVRAVSVGIGVCCRIAEVEHGPRVIKLQPLAITFALDRNLCPCPLPADDRYKPSEVIAIPEIVTCPMEG
jgi:hypothetical protein